ncbi:sortase-dependent protein [Kitasatospora cineracea]
MSRTTSVRRALRLALVPAVAAGVLALPGAVAFADSGSPAPVPTVAPAASATPAPAPATATPTPAVTPAPAGAPGVRWGGSAALPKGGAQTGEGAADGGSATGLVLGAGLAAAGAAGIGLLVVRRRAAARG